MSAAACSRAGNHFATLAAVAAALPGCAVLDGQAVAARWLWQRLTKQPAEAHDLWVELTSLVAEEEAWLGWLWASVAARLRQDVPLAMLLARWVAVLRPDLALHSGPLGRLVAMLRDQESGVTSRSAPSRGKTHRPEELFAQLEETCGAEWQQALLVDLLPRGADGVLEIFRAVLREEELVKSQASTCSEHLPTSAFQWPWGRRAKNAKVAEAVGACRAAVWARRPGIEISTEADLLLASIVLRLGLRMGVLSPSAEDAFDSFAHFTRQQVNLQKEVDLLCQVRSALCSLRQRGMDAAAQVSLPRPIGHAQPEVAIVSWEDGICLSEVTRRPAFGGCYMEEGELSSRRAAARHLARTFWLLLFEHHIALGGLCAGNVLLRTAMDEEQLEVVLLRCGLCHQVDAETLQDLKHLTQLLRRGADSEEVGHLILTRVHCRSGGQAEEVHDLDGFFSSINSLLGKSAGCGVMPPLRGAVLLHRFLEILHRHRLKASEVHLQVATSAAATHAVCSRLDPFSYGGLFEALLEVAPDKG